MRVALRIEVNTERGLRDGVPNLLRLLSEFQVRATFFFPLGNDDTGRHPLRAWRAQTRPGWKSLAYGTLLKGPKLGELGRETMLATRSNGHEVGVFGLSPFAWRDRLGVADEAWVNVQCDELWASCERLLGSGPVALATPGWQANPALYASLSATRCTFSSTSRGKLPYLPVLRGVRSGLPEIPTTLPTVDEMLRQDGVSPDNVHEFMYAESRRVLPAGHVYAASAEREGLDLLPLMEKLLVMWKGQEGSMRALGDVLKEIDLATLPHHSVGWDTPPGADLAMATQSVEVPA